MTTRHLLITRPDHDYATRYLSAWSEKFLSAAKAKGYSLIDLRRERANRKEVKSILVKREPDFVIINGHGDDSVVMGYKNEPLITAGDNSSVLTGKITYAISCRSARVLGKEVGRYVGTAYIGYQEDFILVYLVQFRTRPSTDTLAGLFLDPSNIVVTTLLKGHPVKDAVARGKKEFLRKIQRLLTSEASITDASNVRFLLWNMQNLVAHGDVEKSL